MQVSPSIYMVGQILSASCYIAYAVILFRLSSEEHRYRIAGICMLIFSMIDVLVVVVFDVIDPDAMLIMLPRAIIGLIADYNEYKAHSIVLTDVDHVLSEKWIALWKRYIGCMFGVIASIALMLVVPILGGIVLIGAGIGMIIVSVMKFVYLYRTAKTFREYQSENILNVK